jgi:hypothetical protein
MIQKFNKSQLKLMKPHKQKPIKSQDFTNTDINDLAKKLMFKFPRSVAYQIAYDRLTRKKKIDDLCFVSKKTSKTLVQRNTDFFLNNISSLANHYINQGFTRKIAYSKAKLEYKLKAS